MVEMGVHRDPRPLPWRKSLCVNDEQNAWYLFNRARVRCCRNLGVLPRRNGGWPAALCGLHVRVSRESQHAPQQRVIEHFQPSGRVQRRHPCIPPMLLPLVLALL